MPTQEELTNVIEAARQSGANPGPVDEDVSPILSAACGMGLLLKPSEAYLIWREYSNNSAAGWLIPDDPEEIERAIRIFVIDNPPR